MSAAWVANWVVKGVVTLVVNALVVCPIFVILHMCYSYATNL